MGEGHKDWGWYGLRAKGRTCDGRDGVHDLSLRIARSQSLVLIGRICRWEPLGVLQRFLGRDLGLQDLWEIRKYILLSWQHDFSIVNKFQNWSIIHFHYVWTEIVASTVLNGFQVVGAYDVTITTNTNIPFQDNGNDCGLFTCAFAEHCIYHRPIEFTQSDIPYFRRRIIIDIFEQK